MLGAILTVLVLYVVTIGPYETSLVTESAPWGLLSLALSGDADTARVLIESWDERQRTAALIVIGADHLFLVLYAAGLVLGCLVARHTAPPWWRHVGQVAIAGAIVAAAADWAENDLLAQWLIDGVTPATARLCQLAAVTKHVGQALSVSYLTATVLAIAVRTRDSHRSKWLPVR